jgi:hypothetical protein
VLADKTEIEVHAFHKTKPTIKKLMTIAKFKELPKSKDYIYRAYQINFNKSIV